MTRKERVRMAIAHKQPDFAPYNVDFTGQEYEKVAAYLGDPDFRAKIGNHIETAYFDGYLEAVAGRPGYFQDEFGALWNRNGADKDIGVIEGYMITEPCLESYTFPCLPEERLRAGYQAVVDSRRDTFKFAAIGFSLFERAWTLCGMENLLEYMLLEPRFVHDLLDAICDFNLRVIDLALEYPFDGFHFGDDWGSQRGLIMGPELWREFIKPRLARMYGRVKEKGLVVSQHSCGDVYSVFGDLVDIGLNVYQTFQPEIYDVEKFKAEYGGALTIWGGISTQTLLPVGTPQEVAAETRRLIRILGKDGGYIAAPTHAIPADVPAENVAALIQALQNQ